MAAGAGERVAVTGLHRTGLPLTREREPRASAARGRCVCQGGLRRFPGRYRFGTRGMPRRPRPLPGNGAGPGPGRRDARPRVRADARQICGARGRPPSRCSPATACRATLLRARSARRTRHRIFAANSGVPRARRRLLRRVRRRGCGDPHSHPAPCGGRRGFAPAAGGGADASSRLASPAGATRRRGQRRRRRRPRRRNGCGLKQALLRTPARAWTRRQRTCEGVVPTLRALPRTGRHAGFAARSRAPPPSGRLSGAYGRRARTGANSPARARWSCSRDRARAGSPRSRSRLRSPRGLRTRRGATRWSSDAGSWSPRAA